ncbi:MAG: hypothetical protein VKI81_09540 [Synechococcaceae cyanobacterium]|nr:hypothetical protein [Synechococcaceae cyanobacterium]
MIAPTVHQQLQRADVLQLISAIGRADRAAAGDAAAALERGEVDAVLDAPAAVEAVRGHGGAPAPVSILLLWYVPVRASLLAHDQRSIGVADFTATVPIAFLREPAGPARGTGEHVSEWIRAVESLPRGTMARAERASRIGVRALWWTGCFPGHLRDRYGAGARRAFLELAATMLHEAAGIVANRAPDLADLYVRAARQVELLSDVLHEVSLEYIGAEAHTARGRIDRYLSRLEGEAA